MTEYVILGLVNVFIAAVSQVLLKISAGKKYPSRIREYLNPLVIVAYGLFFVTTVLGVLVYKGLPLSLGPILEATAYIYVTVFGAVIFKEKIGVKKIAALALIIAGIVVYSVFG